MRALILAAGQGSRLRPISDGRPKCLVELNRKPLLEYQLEVFENSGIENVAIVGGYCSDKLKKYNLKFYQNSNFDSTNMVYSLFCAVDFMSEDEDLLISYGDIIYETEVLQTLISSRASLSVVVDYKWKDLWSLRIENPLDDAETLKLASGKIYEIGKKPQSYSDIHAQYIGLIKIKAEYIYKVKSFWADLVSNLNCDSRTLYMTDFLQLLIDSGEPVTACAVSGGWLEVDTVEDLNKYQSLYDNGEIENFINLQGFKY